jgi:hypothetical protein
MKPTILPAFFCDAMTSQALASRRVQMTDEGGLISNDGFS